MSLRSILLPFVVGVFLAAQPPVDPRLVGTWTLERVDNVLADGTRIPLYGDHPQGLLVFDAQGRYALQILREGRPRFASGDKAKGTPEENWAAVAGNNSHFGRWEVNAAGGSLIFRIDHAFFPNWEGTTQVRTFTLEGAELRYTVPTPTTGGLVRGEVIWRRAMTLSQAPRR
jgi:hypothetical protein